MPTGCRATISFFREIAEHLVYQVALARQDISAEDDPLRIPGEPGFVARRLFETFTLLVRFCGEELLRMDQIMAVAIEFSTMPQMLDRITTKFANEQSRC